MSGVASEILTLQSAATATGNGTAAGTDGWNGAQMVRVINTGTGTCTLTLEGSYDATAGSNQGAATWHAVGYQRVDGQANLTRAAAGFAVGATGSGADIVVLQVLDLYMWLRARISAVSGTVSVSVQLYAASE